MIRAIQFQNKRVGSTFLQNAINSHTEIMGIDEVFVNVARKQGMRKSGFVPYKRSDVDTPKEYIEDIIYKTYPEHNTIFKLMYNQIGYHKGLMGFIKENKIPIIHLERKNLVKQVISGLTAATTKHQKIDITPDRLFNMVKGVQQENIYWRKKLKEHIRLRLYYEDIIGENTGDKTYLSPLGNAAVCDFFNVKYEMMFSMTKKKNKEDLSVYLPNLKKIKNRFKNTKYEWMI